MPQRETTDDILAHLRKSCSCREMIRVLEILEGHRRAARRRPSLIAENLALRSEVSRLQALLEGKG